MATKSEIQTKINNRIDNGSNPISTEREISNHFLNELFSAEVIDDYSTQTYTTDTLALEYNLTLKKSGNQVLSKISLRNNRSYTFTASPSVPVKIFDWKTSPYKPNIFNNINISLYCLSATNIVYVHINNIGIWLLSPVPPTAAGILYESNLITYKVLD